MFLYSSVVLIWGSAWLAVKFQIGVVPPEWSIAYRIGCASLIMFAWVWMRRLPLKFSPGDHLFLLLQGMLIFSTNFFLYYQATAHLTTGLIAVISSSASAMTILFTCLLQQRRPAGRVLLGATLGMAGISIIFWPQLAALTWSSAVGRGLLYSLGGTVCFSLGGIIAARNRAAGFPPRANTAWAMFYGGLFISALALANGRPISFDPHPAYIGSLLYLILAGSVAAFAAYFALIGRIEAERAAYVTVLFPVVALSLSTLFEEYIWTLPAFGGVILTLVGNVVVLSKRRAVATRL
ncbi:MAG: DMT family transporter [Proteobacteria bacterium]|nr:DMT family transporter [Pseudomonadota bacterium]